MFAALVAGCLAPILGGLGMVTMALLVHGGDMVRHLYHRWYARRRRGMPSILPPRPLLPKDSD